MLVQILLFLISGDVAEVGEMQWLCMHQRAEIASASGDVIAVHGKVGVNSLVSLSKSFRFDVCRVADLPSSDICTAARFASGFIRYFSQSSAGTRHKEDSAAYLWHIVGQAEGF